MTKKKVIALSCMIALSVCFLIGCRKNKVNDSNTYSIDRISEIQIDIDTWQLNIMASSDEKAHISFDGNISDNVVEPRGKNFTAFNNSSRGNETLFIIKAL